MSGNLNALSDSDRKVVKTMSHQSRRFLLKLCPGENSSRVALIYRQKLSKKIKKAADVGFKRCRLQKPSFRKHVFLAAASEWQVRFLWQPYPVASHHWPCDKSNLHRAAKTSDQVKRSPRGVRLFPPRLKHVETSERRFCSKLATTKMNPEQLEVIFVVHTDNFRKRSERSIGYSYHL